MSAHAVRFDDGASYERFMGRWSRAACPLFLAWLDAPPHAVWLDVGCGTGILTESILERCGPSSVHGSDPAQAQVELARRRIAGRDAMLQVADARELPYADATFDVVASALVINFIPDRPRALAEMRRVARPGGTVAGFVWDFAAERSPSGPMRKSLRAIGCDVPPLPGTQESTAQGLRALFAHAGLAAVETLPIEVTVPFADFEDFWSAQTPAYMDTTRTIHALPERDRARLAEELRACLPTAPDGRIAYAAHAHAVRGRRV